MDLLSWEDGEWLQGQPGSTVFKETLKPSSDHRMFFKVSGKRPLSP